MLPKQFRLALGQNVRLQGQRFRFSFFDLVIQPNDAKRPRLAIIVPAKKIKKAARRVRIKRLVFKALENLIEEIDNVDLLVIVKKDPTFQTSQEATSVLKECLVQTKAIK